MSKSSDELTIVNLPPGGELPTHVVAAFARLAMHLADLQLKSETDPLSACPEPEAEELTAGQKSEVFEGKG